MKFNKNWLLLIPSILITGFLWIFLSFTMVKCNCPWNQWGPIIGTIMGILVLLVQGFSIFILIKKQSKNLPTYYTLSLVVSEVVYFIVMIIFSNILTC